MTETAVATRRSHRRQAVSEFKRAAILDAAREIFAEQGLEGATLRAIAQRAGYAPAALYHHYAGKEHIYADILDRSLAQVEAAVIAARRAGTADGAAQRALRAFFDHYRTHPRDLDLGLYLFRGARRQGLSPELDDKLNRRLRYLVTLMAESLVVAAELSVADAQLAIVDGLSQIIGCLILESTGRLTLFGLDAEALVERRLAQLSFPSSLS